MALISKSITKIQVAVCTPHATVCMCELCEGAAMRRGGWAASAGSIASRSWWSQTAALVLPSTTTAMEDALQWSGQLLVPAARAALLVGNESHHRCAIAARPIRACCDVSPVFLIDMKSLGVSETRCPPPGNTLTGQRAWLALSGAAAAVQVAQARGGRCDCAVRRSW